MHLPRKSFTCIAFACLQCALTAQEPKPGEPKRGEEIPIPSDHEGLDVLELTIEDALGLGRINNLGLKAEELLPMQAIEDLRFEEAFFEPEFFANVRFARSRDPSRNIFQPPISRESLGGQVGLRSQAATGGLYQLSFSPNKLVQETNTPGFPPRQFSSTLNATITQPLLRGAWSDFTLRRVHRARAGLGSSAARFERQVQDTLLAIVEAYWELSFAREDYRVLFQAMLLAQEQLRITEERIRVRDLAERDRVSDEAEVARRKEELIRSGFAIRNREDVLRDLLFDDRDSMIWSRNLRPITSIRDRLQLPRESWQEYARRALDLRPDLRGSRFDLRQAEIDLESARRDLLPQLDLIGSYSSDGVQSHFNQAFTDSTKFRFPDWSVQLEISVPIGNNAAQAAFRRAELEVERNRRLLYSAEQAIQLEVRDSLRRLLTLDESIRAAEESVRLAETVLDTERERLKVGRATIFEVQQRNQELREVRSQLLRNQLDYRIAEDTFRHSQGILYVPEGVPR